MVLTDNWDRFLLELSKCQETQEAAAVAVVESLVVADVATAAPAEEDAAEIEVAVEEPQVVHQAGNPSRWPCTEVHRDRLMAAVDHVEEVAEEAGSTSKRP